VVLVVNEHDESYDEVAQQNGEANMVRKVFVIGGGHCAFTPAETLAAVQTLLHRVNTGRWGDSTNPATMNAEATALGPSLNVFLVGSTLVPAASAFLHFEPTRFLRPFTAHHFR
jgi:hypothetical protein